MTEDEYAAGIDRLLRRHKRQKAYDTDAEPEYWRALRNIPGGVWERMVDLAIDEINATGVTLAGKKVKFELLTEDDQAELVAVTVGTPIARVRTAP